MVVPSVYNAFNFCNSLGGFLQVIGIIVLFIAENGGTLSLYLVQTG